MNRRLLIPVTIALLTTVALGACGDDDAGTSDDAGGTTTLPADPAACAAGKTLKDGVLTVATGNPAFAPWVIDDKPESGQGFEAAVAYAVAGKLGFGSDKVTWVRTGFDEVISPAPKTFDFNLQQYSVLPERKLVVDFSNPYYVTNQALVTQADSPFAAAATIADLKTAKLGAAVGTTSLDFINKVIKPDSEAQVYDDNTGAKTALEANQIDGILVDLPTAGGIAYGEMDNGTIAGQFVRVGDEKGDELAMLFAKGNPLVPCVNAALAALAADGTLTGLEDQWLKGDNGTRVIARG